MKRTILKMTVVLALVLALALPVAACVVKGPGGNGESETGGGILGPTDIVPEGSTVLRLAYFKAGYGDEWMREYCRSYHKLHEEIYFLLEGNVSIDGSIEGRLRAAESGMPVVDLFTTQTISAFELFAKNGWVEDLTDLYEEDIGDGYTMSELMEERCDEYAGIGGSKYVVPWVNAVTGFVYNKKMFAQYNWALPKTLEDLLTLFSKIKTDTGGKVKPMAFNGSQGGYFNTIAPQWFAQYAGESKYNEFYRFESPDVFKMSGRLEMYQALQTLFEDKANFPAGVGGYDHIAAQTAFLDGEAAIIPNGSWLETEMSEYWKNSKYSGFEMAFMPLPKIYASKSGDKLLDAAGNEVKDYNISTTTGFFIPKRSANKAVIKDFLKLMHTQENLKIFAEKAGAPRPFEIKTKDYSYLSSAFKKSMMELYQNSVKVTDYSDALIFRSGEVVFAPNNSAYSTKIFNGFNVNTMVTDEYNYAKQRFDAFFG